MFYSWEYKEKIQISWIHVLIYCSMDTLLFLWKDKKVVMCFSGAASEKNGNETGVTEMAIPICELHARMEE